MNPKDNRWTRQDELRLKRLYAKVPPATLARWLCRSVVAIKSRAKVLGLRRSDRRPLSAAELRIVRRHYRTLPIRLLLKELPGRSASGIYQAANRLGLTISLDPHRYDGFEAFLIEKHRQGWSDQEISEAWGRRVPRDQVRDRRHALGLPSNVCSERRRQRVREKTAEQLRKAGLPSIGWLRAMSFRQYQIGRGWAPERCGVLGPRYVQVLDALWERGPQSRRELATVIGMPWKGIRKSLTGNAEGGSILATLMQRGLVVCLGRIIRHPDCGKGNRAGQGHNTRMYSLPLGIQRGPVTWPDSKPPPGLKKSIVTLNPGASHEQKRTA